MASSLRPSDLCRAAAPLPAAFDGLRPSDDAFRSRQPANREARPSICQGRRRSRCLVTATLAFPTSSTYPYPLHYLIAANAAVNAAIAAPRQEDEQQRQQQKEKKQRQHSTQKGKIVSADLNRNRQRGKKEAPERQVVAIATDVDGTLLDSCQRLSERTERALKLAMEQGVEVILATGKARGPWVTEVMQRLGLTTPGVFLQGLMIYSADGIVLYERTLEQSVASEVIEEAEKRNITLTAYCGERILCEETNAHTDRLIGYGEPAPEAVGPLSGIVGAVPIHKLLFMADDESLAELRRELEVSLAGRATLVTALHGMLEVLPLGASKAVGLSTVLETMGLCESDVLAAGDGENDIEMLRMAGFSVAMGNASGAVKSEADHVTLTNDNDGLAHAVERFVLKPGFWCWD